MDSQFEMEKQNLMIGDDTPRNCINDGKHFVS